MFLGKAYISMISAVICGMLYIVGKVLNPSTFWCIKDGSALHGHRTTVVQSQSFWNFSIFLGQLFAVFPERTGYGSQTTTLSFLVNVAYMWQISLESNNRLQSYEMSTEP